ncbi:MAG: hypothetical protein KJP02_06735, partial [Octadecabacter sp.]|nr:hypothetical protein [Octadecabacter sp.]
MPVENNLLPENLPKSTIGIKRERPMRPEDQPTQVRDPDGKLHTMSRSNARDKVRLDGWQMAVKTERPQPEAAPVAEVDKDVEDIGEEAVGGNREPTELDHLRAEYIEKAGKQPDMRWGKKALQE